MAFNYIITCYFLAFEGSVILSRNKTYEPKLKEFLKPVVGDNRQWKLCFRASIHGWNGKTFHNRCDGKRDTVTIARNGENVFGGYVDTAWGNYNNCNIILIAPLLAFRKGTSGHERTGKNA